MIRINLLPVRAAKKKELGRQQLVLFAGLMFLAVALNGFWWWSVESDKGERLERETKLKSDIAQLERIIGEVNTISKDKEALEAKLAVLANLKKGRTGPVRLLDALATLMPPKAWVRELKEQGGSITLKGGAVSNEDVADLLREMKKSPFFKEPTLKSSKLKDDKKAGGMKYLEFEITSSITYAA